MRGRRDHPRPDDYRQSRMPEAQWRAEGWLAQPTQAQVYFPTLGCCAECTMLLHRKRWKPGLRVGMMFGAIFVFGAVFWWLLELFVP